MITSSHIPANQHRRGSPAVCTSLQGFCSGIHLYFNSTSKLPVKQQMFKMSVQAESITVSLPFLCLMCSMLLFFIFEKFCAVQSSAPNKRCPVVLGTVKTAPGIQRHSVWDHSGTVEKLQTMEGGRAHSKP